MNGVDQFRLDSNEPPPVIPSVFSDAVSRISQNRLPLAESSTILPAGIGIEVSASVSIIFGVMAEDHEVVDEMYVFSDVFSSIGPSESMLELERISLSMRA